MPRTLHSEIDKDTIYIALVAIIAVIGIACIVTICITPQVLLVKSNPDHLNPEFVKENYSEGQNTDSSLVIPAG